MDGMTNRWTEAGSGPASVPAHPAGGRGGAVRIRGHGEGVVMRNTWEGCPQSRLHLEVRSSRREEAIAMMQAVVRTWDGLIPARPLPSWTPWRRRVRHVADHFFRRWLQQGDGAGLNRRAHCHAGAHQRAAAPAQIRRNLAAIAFLEVMETAVDAELQQRRSGCSGTAVPIPGSPAPTGEGCGQPAGGVPESARRADRSRAEGADDVAAP
jgi:hypothetical protein